MNQIIRVFLLGAVLIGLSSCGSIAGAQPAGAGPSGNPDHVRIKIDQPSPNPLALSVSEFSLKPELAPGQSQSLPQAW